MMKRALPVVSDMSQLMLMPHVRFKTAYLAVLVLEAAFAKTAMSAGDIFGGNFIILPNL